MEALKRFNPGEFMIRRKDSNILLFMRKIMAEDPLIRERAKQTGIDKVEILPPLIQSRLLHHQAHQKKNEDSGSNTKTIEEELKGSEATEDPPKEEVKEESKVED